MAVSATPGHVAGANPRSSPAFAFGWPYSEWKEAREAVGTSHVERGIGFAQEGRFSEAVAAYDRALARQPDLVIAHTFRAHALAQDGRFSEAIAAAELAIHFAPNSSFGYGARAFVNRLAERHNDVIADLRRVIAIEPDQHRWNGILGTALFKARRFDEAVEAYDRALKFTEGNDQHLLRVERSIALAAAKRLDEALIAIDEIIDGPTVTKENLSPLFSLRASFLESTGFIPESIIDHAKSLIHLNTEDFDLKEDVNETSESLFRLAMLLQNSSNIDYYNDMINTASALMTFAKQRGLPDDVVKAIGSLAANAARETTDRAPAEQRPGNAPPVRTADELFGMSASAPARRYHKSDGPEFSAEELADRVLLAAAEATRNEMKSRAKLGELSPEERARWRKAGRFVYHARK